MKNTIKATYIGHSTKPRDYLALAIRNYQNAENKAHKLEKASRSRAARKILRVKERARRVGFKLGESRAKIDIANKFTDYQEQYESIVKKAHNDCLALALDLAKDVIESELKNQPDSLVGRISRSIEFLLDQREIKIFINENEFEKVANKLKEKIPELRATFHSTSDITQGNAIIETAAGVIEINWQDYFKSLEKKLVSKLGVSAC